MVIDFIIDFTIEFIDLDRLYSAIDLFIDNHDCQTVRIHSL